MVAPLETNDASKASAPARSGNDTMPTWRISAALWGQIMREAEVARLNGMSVHAPVNGRVNTMRTGASQRRAPIACLRAGSNSGPAARRTAGKSHQSSETRSRRLVMASGRAQTASLRSRRKRGARTQGLYVPASEPPTRPPRLFGLPFQPGLFQPELLFQPLLFQP